MVQMFRMMQLKETMQVYFREDLGLVYVETMKKSSNSPFDLLSFISSMYSLSNYAFTGSKNNVINSFVRD